MPPIMSEAYARGLINKIMTEAFDVLDTTAQSEISMAHHQAEHLRNPLETSQSDMHLRNDTMGSMETVLRGLSEIPIGEPAPITRYQLTVLEEEVKRAACSINESIVCESIAIKEPCGVRGQGEVTASQTVIEIQADSEESESASKSREPIKGYLQTVEHLELKPKGQLAIEKPQSSNEELLGRYNEKEELDNEDTKKDMAETVPVIDMERVTNSYDLEEPKISATMLPSTSFARHASLEEIPITETISHSPSSPERGMTLHASSFLSADQIHGTPSFDEIRPKNKRMKKIGLFGRLRRLICNAFGRRKN